MFKKVILLALCANITLAFSFAPARADVATDIAAAIQATPAGGAGLVTALEAILTGVDGADALTAAQAALAASVNATPDVQSAIGAALSTMRAFFASTDPAIGVSLDQAVNGSGVAALQSAYFSQVSIGDDTGAGSNGGLDATGDGNSLNNNRSTTDSTSAG